MVKPLAMYTFISSEIRLLVLLELLDYRQTSNIL